MSDLAQQRRWFTVDDFYKMADSGILARGERVELIEGEIIEMSPVGSRHAASVKRLIQFLSAALGDRAVLGAQDPVRLDDFSEPEPDVSVLRPRADFYAENHPGLEDIFLLVEVSDSSLSFDRDVKLPVYAAAGVPEVWVVNLVDSVLEVHTTPERGGYADVRHLHPGETVAAKEISGLELQVTSILG